MHVPARFKGVLELTVRHFAGEVLYSLDGFLDKNVDRPPEEAPELLENSKLQVLQETENLM